MNPPQSLLELQRWTIQVLLQPLREQGELSLPVFEPRIAQEIEEKMEGGPHLTASQKLGIHNLQFWFRMFVLIQGDYPGLLRLFGYQEFNRAIVEPFLFKYLPDHWSLDAIGKKLPRWIEEEYREVDKTLVLPMAQIDAIYKELLFLRSLPPPTDLNAPLYLQPVLLEVEGDLLSFRDQLMQQEPLFWEEHDFPKIDWSRNKKYVFYLLHEKVLWEELSLGEWSLLKAFEKGATLAQACESLTGELAEEAAPEIAKWFQTWAERGWFTNTSSVYCHENGRPKFPS